MLIDLNTEFGRRVARRLQEERVIWFTTVRNDRTPQPTPVWFLWNGESLLIFSRPQAQKLRNITYNEKVALNFDGDQRGGDIVIFWGDAELEKGTPAGEIEQYMAKYQEGLKRIGMTSEEFARSYSVAIRVRPVRLIGH